MLKKPYLQYDVIDPACKPAIIPVPEKAVIFFNGISDGKKPPLYKAGDKVKTGQKMSPFCRFRRACCFSGFRHDNRYISVCRQFRENLHGGLH